MGFLGTLAGMVFSRYGAYALVAALIGYSYWYAYDAGKDARTAWANAQVAEAKAETAKKATEIQALKDEKKDWLDRTEQAVKVARTEQAALVSELEVKLKSAQTQKAVVRTAVKEVTRYVSPSADAACPIPAGFVWLHNLPLNPELAGRPPVDVDAPSGIAASDVARITAENLAECVERGEVIEAWQQWYTTNKTIFERVKRESSRVPEPANPGPAVPVRIPDGLSGESNPHLHGLAYGIW